MLDDCDSVKICVISFLCLIRQQQADLIQSVQGDLEVVVTNRMVIKCEREKALRSTQNEEEEV